MQHAARVEALLLNWARLEQRSTPPAVLTRLQRSEYSRPETIEETAELVTQAGGQGIAVQTDHLDAAQVRALVERIDRQYGRLDVLVNDVWGAEHLTEWDVPVWKHSLETGLHILRLAIDTHIITSHFALPLLIRNPGGLVVEVTDGTAEYNGTHYRSALFYWSTGKGRSPQYDTLVIDLLREAALFIEWSAKGVPPSLLLDLAPLQRELVLWHRVWPQEALRPLLALQARHLSDRLLCLAQLTPSG